MSERNQIIGRFLANTPWSDWTRTPLAGDASTRRYERLQKENNTIILMDAAPESTSDTTAFTTIAQYLTECGLCAPDILAHDHDLGLLVLGDLGSTDFAKWLKAKPTDSQELYKAAIDVLVMLQTCKAPEGLIYLTPDVATEMIGITGDYYAQADLSDLMKELHATFEQFAPQADTFAMRDFHAENLIWRPDLAGTAKVGLLDFQDAFIAPKGYDLASLLRDARRDLEPRFVEDMVLYYLEKTKQDDAFRVQLACLGIQRNLRILGVFARLASVSRKNRYVDLIPRVWYNLLQDLAHPALGQLRHAVHDCIPPPSTSFLERLRR